MVPVFDLAPTNFNLRVNAQMLHQIAQVMQDHNPKALFPFPMSLEQAEALHAILGSMQGTLPPQAAALYHQLDSSLFRD